jgi:hypothetical protein
MITEAAESSDNLGTTETNLLWRIESLLGNDSVNIFPRKQMRAKIERLLLGNGSLTRLKQYGTIEDGVFRVVRPEAT